VCYQVRRCYVIYEHELLPSSIPNCDFE
jgi:hypothetical protein